MPFNEGHLQFSVKLKTFAAVQKRGAEAPRFLGRICIFLEQSARRRRGDVALALHDDLVERAQIGLGRGDQRIRIGRRAVIERPSWASRTDTSACASVPSVTAWT